jgi:hypothetical protein
LLLDDSSPASFVGVGKGGDPAVGKGVAIAGAADGNLVVGEYGQPIKCGGVSDVKVVVL